MIDVSPWPRSVAVPHRPSETSHPPNSPPDETLNEEDHDGGGLVAHSPDFEVSVAILDPCVDVAGEAEQAQSDGHGRKENGQKEYETAGLAAVPGDEYMIWNSE